MTFFYRLINLLVNAEFFYLQSTSELEIYNLPPGVRNFFSGGLSTTAFAFSDHTVPRFSLQIDGKFDLNLLIDLYSAKLSQDLVQQYVQILHHRVHFDDQHKEVKIIDTREDDLPPHCQNSHPTESTEAKDSKRMQGNELIVQSHRNHDLITPNSPANKDIKGMLAIASFGYQILQLPHFAELCWATSRLKEGPRFDVTGSWKVWPFNSCIVRPCSVSISKNGKDIKNFSVINGLVAVGLIAYKGGYSCVREVSFEVRNVLELLVSDIIAKIQRGKDRYCYHRILSQVAYLEDMVNCWAYTLQR